MFFLKSNSDSKKLFRTPEVLCIRILGGVASSSDDVASSSYDNMSSSSYASRFFRRWPNASSHAEGVSVFSVLLGCSRGAANCGLMAMLAR